MSTGYNLEEVRKLAATQLNFFAPLALPEVCTLAFPPYYEALWSTLHSSLSLERAFDKFALGFPRGHAKTLLLKLLILSVVLNTQNKFILIVCANQDRAKDVLRDVCAMLDSQNIQQVYGNWRTELSIDKAEFKQFTFGGRTIALAAAGQGTSIRGFNVGYSRPDVILCDDAQTRECAASITESLQYIEWFFATLMKAKNPTRCTYLYIGNMYRDLKIKPNLFTCLLRNLQKSTNWKSYIVGAILANGQALWEELQPLEQLLSEYLQDTEMGQGEVFAAEVLNDPTYKPKSGLDPTSVVTIEPTGDMLHQGNYIIIDPSGYKKTSDPTAIGYCEVYDATPCVVELHEEILTPSATIYKVLNLALEKGCSLVCVENVAYQDTLLFWFNFISHQQNIHGIEFLPITTGGYSKNSRILRSFEEVKAKELAFTPTALALWLSRAMSFDPIRVNNLDDTLDVVAYAPKVFATYGHLLAIQGQATVIEHSDTLPADQSPACF